MQFFDDIGLSKFVAIDLETTGLDPSKDKIIEISAVKFNNGEVVDSLTFLVNPEIKLKPKIIQITGINDSMLVSKPSFDDIKDHFLMFIENLPIVGHNVMFDLNFLKKNIHDYEKYFKGRMICDTYYLSKIFYYDYSSFSLTSLCKTVGIEINNAHRAEDDARNSGFLLINIIKEKYFFTNILVFQKIYECLKSFDVPNKEFFRKTLDFLINKNKDQFLDSKNKTYQENFSFSTEYSDNLIDDITIDKLFAEEGILSDKLDSFERRENQIKFCKDIVDVLKNDTILVSEAGAGLGKSYAYLFASLFSRNENNSQIIISTNTHNLQTQLFKKDIPLVLDILKYKCRTTIIKGMNNYICLTRLEELIKNIKNNINAYEALELSSIFYWLDSTVTGDIAECNGFSKRHYNKIWNLISSKSDYCLSHRCNKFDGCFYKNVRDTASISDILIVNHSMLIRYYDSVDSFIPQDSICIVDECHNFHSICQKQLTQSISNQFLNEHKKQFKNILDNFNQNEFSYQIISDCRELLKDFENLNENFNSLCTEIFFNNVQSPFNSDYSQNFSISKSNFFIENGVKILDLIQSLKSIIITLKDYKISIKENIKKTSTRYILGNIEIFIRGLESDLLFFKNLTSENNNFINWISYTYKNNTLKKVSINIAPEKLNDISADIFSRFRASVFCSATLSTDSGFEFFLRQMGMQDLVYNDKIKLSKYSSPYYYQDQSKLFIINKQNTNSETEHIKKVAEDIIELSTKINKRILILCTSYKQIYDFQTLMDLNDDLKNRCLYQLKGTSKSILLSEYLSNKNSILFGTNTFWEGIDLPNDKLEVLIIYKLPFSNPSDPYVKSNINYYQSRNLDAFTEYQLQDTILKLRQGFGRLIRSYSDMGVCIITDQRIATKRYGMHIINSLPVEPNFYSNPYVIIDCIKNFLI